MSSTPHSNPEPSPLRGLLQHLEREEMFLIEVRHLLQELLQSEDPVRARHQWQQRMRDLVEQSRAQGRERQHILEHLAQALGSSPHAVTLTQLVHRLPPQHVAPLIAARSRLLRIGEQVQQQLSTLRWMQGQTQGIVTTILEYLTGAPALGGYNAAGRELLSTPAGGTLSRS